MMRKSSPNLNDCHDNAISEVKIKNIIIFLHNTSLKQGPLLIETMPHD